MEEAAKKGTIKMFLLTDAGTKNGLAKKSKQPSSQATQSTSAMDLA